MKTALRRGKTRSASSYRRPPEPVAGPTGKTWNEFTGDYLLLRHRDGAAATPISRIAMIQAAPRARPIREITPSAIIAPVRPIEISGRIGAIPAIRTRCRQSFKSRLPWAKPMQRKRGSFAGQAVGLPALIDAGPAQRVLTSTLVRLSGGPLLNGWPWMLR